MARLARWGKRFFPENPRRALGPARLCQACRGKRGHVWAQREYPSIVRDISISAERECQYMPTGRRIAHPCLAIVNVLLVSLLESCSGQSGEEKFLMW